MAGINPNPGNSSQKRKKTIVLIDDHQLILESLSQILNSQATYRVVATSNNAEEGIRAARAYHPDLIITDINMPGMNGMDAIALLLQASPHTKVIGMSMHTQPAYARKMLKSGAFAYVTKNSPVDELLKAIGEAGEGRKYICTEIKNIITQQYTTKSTDEENNINCLSVREMEVITLIKNGLSSREIAMKLHLSPKTIEVHRYNILKKLKLNNTAALVNYLTDHCVLS